MNCCLTMTTSDRRSLGAEIFMRGNRFSSTKIRVKVNMWWKCESKINLCARKMDLTRLLSKAVNFDDVFTLEELHGFLFGLAITPELIMPSDWLPVVFGEEMMEFDSKEEAGDMMAPLFLVCNGFYEEHHKGKLFFSLASAIWRPEISGGLATGQTAFIKQWL